MKKFLKRFISMLLILSMCSVTVYADDLGLDSAGDAYPPDVQYEEAVNTGGDIPPQIEEPTQPGDTDTVQPEEPAPPNDTDTIQPEEPTSPGDTNTIQPEGPTQPGDADAIQPKDPTPSEDSDADISSGLDQDDTDDDIKDDEDADDTDDDSKEDEDSEGEEKLEQELIEYEGGIYTVTKPSGEESDSESEIELQAYSSVIEVYQALEGEVKKALLAGEEWADVRGLKISSKKYNIAYLNSFSPYLSNGCGVTGSYYYEDNIITRVQLVNSMSQSDTKAYFNRVDAKVSEIINQAAGLSSAEQMALAIHDYFACQYQYDLRLYSGDMPEDSYRSGGLFMNECGVCQAYAYGYMYIMGRLGVECYVASSKSMKHGWNIINIDGSYYHVDITWDDPIFSDKSGEYLGMVRHTYFLLSDTAVQEVGSKHSGWDLSYKCVSTRYDNAYWKNVNSPIILSGNKAYYISGTSIVSSNLSGGSVSTLKKSLGSWPVWGGGGSWIGAFSGLFLHNNELYYNTATEIRKISLNGQNDASVSSPSTSSGYIYGCRKYNMKIEYVLGTAPNSTKTKKSTNLPGGTSTPAKKYCQVTYNANGGSVSTSSAKLVQGSKYGELPKPTRKGYKFAGWYTAKKGGEKIGSSSTVPKTSKQTIYAQWKKAKYTITYQLNGGTNGANPASYTVTDAVVLKNPTRKGCAFKGWYTDSAYKTKVTQIAKGSTGNKTLYAKWSATKYTITYNLNSGKNASGNPSSYTVTTKTITLKNPTRTGYTFKGWYTDSAYKTKVTQIAKGSTGNKKLYAKWAVNSYKIQYNKNGGTGSMNATSCKYDKSCKLRKNAFKRKGYTFAGWATSKKGKVVYKNSQSVNKLVAKNGGTITLYAVWKKK